MPQPFRFGLQVNTPFADLDWTETARKVEDLGFSSLLVPDHFSDQWGPIAGLAAAAAVTSELKLGALVFGNDYRHPVVLAKEMATIDRISNGRLEVGIGAGWMRDDYTWSGMSYDRPGERIDRMIESLEIMRRCWAGESFSFAGSHYNIAEYTGHPAPANAGGPTVIIGGGGRRMLKVAADRADIVAVTANLRAGEVGPDAIADSSPEAYDAKIARVREVAGRRADSMELSSLAMMTVHTDDQAGAHQNLALLFDMPPEVVAQSPAALVGNVDQMCEQLIERRERWGFNYVVIQADTDLDAFAQVIARLAGT